MTQKADIEAALDMPVASVKKAGSVLVIKLPPQDSYISGARVVHLERFLGRKVLVEGDPADGLTIKA